MGPAQELRAAPPLGTVETGGEDLQKPKEGAQWPGRRIWHRNKCIDSHFSDHLRACVAQLRSLTALNNAGQWPHSEARELCKSTKESKTLRSILQVAQGTCRVCTWEIWWRSRRGA